VQPSWPEMESDFAAALLATNAANPPYLGELSPERVARGMAIHRNNFRVSLIDALKDNFPVTALLVGEEFFAAMVGIFVTQCPPRSAVLAEYGAALPDFIEGFAPADGVPYLADVARLETAWLAGYHAAEAAALSPADLRAVPLDAMVASAVNFHPATRLVRSNHPVASIWQRQRTGSREEVVWRAEAAVVVRPEADVRIVCLEPAAGIYASLLMSGRTIEQAATECAALYPHFDPGKSLIELVLAGAVQSIETPTVEPRRPG